MDPKTTRKVKALKKFSPATSDIRPTIVADFTAQQSRLIEKMKETQHSEFGPDRGDVTGHFNVITYSLLDAYRLIVFTNNDNFCKQNECQKRTAFHTNC